MFAEPSALLSNSSFSELCVLNGATSRPSGLAMLISWAEYCAGLKVEFGVRSSKLNNVRLKGWDPLESPDSCYPGHRSKGSERRWR